MSDTLSQPLAAAIRGVLNPLVRILLRNGVPFGVFMENAKQVYVGVAARELALPNRKPSVSRVSVITGLTRKEVSRLWKRPDNKPRGVERYHRGARVVTAWAREKRYRDARGRPRVLAFDGRGATFSDLVLRYGGDVPPRAVLDELLRVDAVGRARDGRLRLLKRAYVPKTDDADRLGILASDVPDLIASIDHNLTHPPEQAFFQRRVAYDNLISECLPILRGEAAKRGQTLLEFFDRLMSKSDRDANPKVSGTKRNRAVLGIYYYEHPFDGDD